MMHSKSIANAARWSHEYADEPPTEVQELKACIQELETQNEKLREAINNFPSVAVCAALTSWGIGLSFSENINELITACANFADFKQALEDS